MLVNVLKELDSVSENHFEEKEDQSSGDEQEQPQQMYNNRGILGNMNSIEQFNQGRLETSYSHTNINTTSQTNLNNIPRQQVPIVTAQSSSSLSVRGQGSVNRPGTNQPTMSTQNNQGSSRKLNTA